MNIFATLSDRIASILDIGGPVVLILLGLSVVSVAMILFKLVQFAANGVGRQAKFQAGLTAWDKRDLAGAKAALLASKNGRAHIIAAALDHVDHGAHDRVEAELSAEFDRLERGFRVLDSIAQIAPLLGLFGTVLGMIDAFRALQAAGSAVDPSLLAGGIWVALLTTAVGLAVAMPTQIMLTWLESRVDRERSIAVLALERAFCPTEAANIAQRPIVHAV